MWPGALTPGLVRHVLHFIQFSVEQQDMSPSVVTVEWMDKARDATPGAIVCPLAKVQLVSYTRSLLEGLPQEAPARQEVALVLDPFASYKTYSDTFSTSKKQHGKDKGDMDPAEEDPFHKLRKTVSRLGQVVLASTSSVAVTMRTSRSCVRHTPAHLGC